MNDIKIYWQPSSHPISDIRDWSNRRRLEVRPDFQRKEVWSDAARVFLMDTILSNIPMPKIFLQTQIKDGDTYRVVIDGQQRLLAILAFLNNDYKLEPPYVGPHQNAYFRDLPQDTQDDFLAYKVDTNEIRNATEETIRTIYSRVNKYTFALTKQELRRADFPGDFLRLSEKLAALSFFEESRIFTLINSKRMRDVEFISELLALLIAGPQDKRETLDDFYLKYMHWDEAEMQIAESRFLNAVTDIQKIWSVIDPKENALFEQKEFSKTRFRQKADFYALLAAIDECRGAGDVLDGKPLSYLLTDLSFVDAGVEPEASIPLFSKYAIQCLSQSNTIASRRWRKDFLLHCIKGTYSVDYPSVETVKFFHLLLDEYYNAGDPMCSARYSNCPICGQDVNDYSPDNVFLTWHRSAKVHQIFNSEFIHASCKLKASQDYDTSVSQYTIDKDVYNF